MEKNEKAWYDVDLTYDLLNTPESDRTDVENEAVARHIQSVKDRNRRMEDANGEIRTNCVTLCSGYEDTMIPSPGWIEPVSELCYSLEKLNIDNRKYGFQVDVSQSKSKYATLHFYYDIRSRPVGLFGYVHRILTAFAKRLDVVDYGRITVEDEPPKVTVEWAEISEDKFMNKANRYEYDKRKRSGITFNECEYEIKKLIRTFDTIAGLKSSEEIYGIYKIGELTPISLNNVNVYKTEGGKHYIAYELHHPRKTHTETTRHKILDGLRKLFNRMALWCESRDNMTPERTVVLKDFKTKVSNLVRHAERECEKLCEDCGREFSPKYEWHHECHTIGWLSYVCKSCAKMYGTKYFDTVDGKTYVGNTVQHM